MQSSPSRGVYSDAEGAGRSLLACPATCCSHMGGYAMRGRCHKSTGAPTWLRRCGHQGSDGGGSQVNWLGARGDALDASCSLQVLSRWRRKAPAGCSTLANGALFRALHSKAGMSPQPPPPQGWGPRGLHCRPDWVKVPAEKEASRCIKMRI